MENYSAVDSEYKPKMPFYWIAASQEPQVIIGRKDNGKIVLYAVNDTLEEFSGVCEISYIDGTGNICNQKQITFTSAKNTSSKFAELDMPAEPMLMLFKHGNITNHLITGYAPFDFEKCRLWAEILRGIYQY